MCVCVCARVCVLEYVRQSVRMPECVRIYISGSVIADDGSVR